MKLKYSQTWLVRSYGQEMKSLQHLRYTVYDDGNSLNPLLSSSPQSSWLLEGLQMVKNKVS